MEQYYYSASKNQLLPESLFEDYQSAGSWPDDAEPVSDDLYQEFGANPAPAGKIMVTGDDGLPVWGDLPAPSPEELIAQAEAKKAELLAIADAAIAPLSRAVKLKMATDEEAGKLEEWERYSVLINRVDTSTVQDIDWPEQPK